MELDTKTTISKDSDLRISRWRLGAILGGILGAVSAWGLVGGWNWILLFGVFPVELSPALLSLIPGFLIGATIGAFVSLFNLSRRLLVVTVFVIGILIAFHIPLGILNSLNNEAYSRGDYDAMTNIGVIVLGVIALDFLIGVLLAFTILIRLFISVSRRLAQLARAPRITMIAAACLLAVFAAFGISWGLHLNFGIVLSEAGAARSAHVVALAEGWEVESIGVAYSQSAQTYHINILGSDGRTMVCFIAFMELPPPECREL